MLQEDFEEQEEGKEDAHSLKLYSQYMTNRLDALPVLHSHTLLC